MAKKDFGGGLDALFNGTDQTQEQASSVEAPETKAPEFVQEPTTPEDENDLINSVEDEQLRAALRAKRMDGRGRPRKNTDKNGKRTDGYSRTSLNKACFNIFHSECRKSYLKIQQTSESSISECVKIIFTRNERSRIS